LKITIAGQSKTVVKTSQITKFGPSPIWNEEFVFDIVDECIIQIEMYAQTTYDHSEEIYQHEKEPDKLIGTNNYSLLQVFKNGIESAWLPLKLPKPGGKSMRETGKIYMTSSFNGPTGVSFPQHRSNIITYDDKYRRSQTDIRSSHKSRSEEHGESDNIMEDQSVELEAAPSTIVGNKEKVIHKDIQKSVQNKHEELQRALSFESEDKYAPKDTVSEGSHRDQTEQEVLPKEIPDFTDEEIVAAFRFIDLDHNNYVGAKEIRHVLICMGELITDEEVDMMISLVDTDGDGQISLEEFRALVLSKNIENNNDYDEGIQHRAKSMKQFSTKSLQDVDHIKIKSESLSSEDKIVLTLEDLAQQRQKEMKLRDDKKRHLITFVAENDVSYERVKMYYQLFTELPLLDRPHNCVNYDNFLSCLMIESMSEYEKLFRLFLPEFTASSHRRDDESIDFRQFLLSLMNFVSIPREQRIKFSFIMYDENRTGVITQVELEDILRGNHMTNLISVKRKAETVMKQISKDGMNGSITMNELIIISKKFPNILIPTIQNRS
jgi:Ca2+-binding EF-hand superfamily protein